jgi:methanogenic corrinoid protein MtbC1
MEVSKMIQLIIETVIGLSVTGACAVVVKSVKRPLEQIKAIGESVAALQNTVSDLVDQTQVHAKNTLVIRKAMKPIFQSLRSYGYALQEAGCNGSTKIGRAKADEGEDILNERDEENAAVALGVAQ